MAWFGLDAMLCWWWLQCNYSISEWTDPLEHGAFQTRPPRRIFWLSHNCIGVPYYSAPQPRQRPLFSPANWMTWNVLVLYSSFSPNLAALIEQFQIANLSDVDSWTEWSKYSTCSATCGNGSTFRTRRCTAVDGSDAPTLSECPDRPNDGDFQNRSCSLGPCCKYHSWILINSNFC